MEDLRYDPEGFPCSVRDRMLRAGIHSARRKEFGGTSRMRAMRHLASIGLLVLSASASEGQAPAGAVPLRLAWESAPPAYGLQAVCGRVFNDGAVDARRVRVRVEGLNDRGEVTSRRDGDVL